MVENILEPGIRANRNIGVFLRASIVVAGLIAVMLSAVPAYGRVDEQDEDENIMKIAYGMGICEGVHDDRWYKEMAVWLDLEPYETVDNKGIQTEARNSLYGDDTFNKSTREKMCINNKTYNDKVKENAADLKLELKPGCEIETNLQKFYDEKKNLLTWIMDGEKLNWPEASRPQMPSCQH
ncbi:hypothetical protein [Nocardia arthritidis]|uniref:Uncharacterized protein n=1 Tax=Nocardia arthritidis TaxID=228602 RepID=A0A6G9Y6Q9_9NOCA|nr:hypothetical protein [Nocardia arthritidis]QIS08767.1 hypothetical protein F5544_04265 [Nocardia arthritidis]